MLLNKTIKIKIIPNNIKKYSDLLNKDLNIDDIIDLPIEYLSLGSNIIVDIKCDLCDNIFHKKYKEYNKQFNLCETITCKNCEIERKKLICLEKHGVDFKNDPGLAGYYDCNRNYHDKCDICTIYWKLKNSKNQADVEKAQTVNRTTKYYSYVLVIEDEQHPELVGQILVFPYGYTVKEKINSERNGEVTGVSCNIFDLQKGKDFKLIIKEKGGFQNYDSCQFMDSSPIKLYDEKTKAFKVAPLDENGNITNPKVQAKIKETLLNRVVDMDEHKPVEWSEETKSKVSRIVSILQGDDVYVAEQSVRNSSNSSNRETVSNNTDTTTADDFFSLDSDDDL